MNTFSIRFSLALVCWASLAIAITFSPVAADDQIQVPKKFARFEESNPQAKILFSGQVRTADGTPLPDGAKLMYHSDYHYHDGSFLGTGTAYYGDIYRDLAPNGRFSGAPRYGYKEEDFAKRVRFYFTATAPGYAPTWIGPIKAKPGGSVDNLNLTLEHGFDGRLQLTDQKGDPIVGAKLEMRYQDKKGALPGELISDGGGIVVVPDCASTWIDANIRHPGFQQSRFKVKLAPDELKKHELLLAHPTSGYVLSSESGLPIAQAKILILEEETRVSSKLFGFSISYGTGGYGFTLKTAPVVAQSDELGRFIIDTFREGDSYDLAVTAPGYKEARLTEIQSGQKNLSVKLEPLPDDESPE